MIEASQFPDSLIQVHFCETFTGNDEATLVRYRL